MWDSAQTAGWRTRTYCPDWGVVPLFETAGTLGDERFVKTAANRSYCPRLSEATHLLPLLRDCLVEAAPRPLATTLDLVPIVEDGLFGYELMPDRETHIYPIIGCNAQGEPVLRKNSYGVAAPHAMHLVAVNGRLHSSSGRATCRSIERRDNLFPNWLAAAESAWEQLLILCPGPPRHAPILGENAHRRLDKALSVAHSHLYLWDPFIEFIGLPNEAQFGFMLSGTDGESGKLTFQQPDTWTLSWSASPEAVNKSWSPMAKVLNHRAEDYRGFPDRRAQCRRAKNCGRFADSSVGNDRRKTYGRRTMDQRAT